jgi:transglutaminase-like putative cysteine protease
VKPWRPGSRVLAWLAAALATVLLPHVLHLPPWVLLLSLGGVAWYGWAALGDHRLPPAWLRAILALGAAAAVYATQHTLFGRDAGVSLLVVMAGLKLLELRSHRDAMLVIFLAYFLIVTQFLFSQEIPMAAYLFAAVFMVTGALVALNREGRSGDPWEPARVAGRLLLQALPLMLVLFLLFPRVPGPLWSLPRDAHSGQTGLSDRMEPGSISRLSQSDAVAFRVAFEGAAPPPGERYWRGPVLWSYDGRAWTPGWISNRGASGDELQPLGGAVSYTLTLEPHNQPWLLALDVPAAAPERTRLTADLRLQSRRPVTERLRYRATSYTEYRAGTRLLVLERAMALRLPESGDPRTRALARELRSASSNDPDLVRRALARFREQPFVYTLTPPLLGQDPVDGFLFETRRGFCEHYAGAFVFLMRAAGIPARVVTGYLGGEANTLSDYYIVRQSDAHAWAEVWLPEQGWVRVDPTAAVAPQRVERGLQAAVAEGEPLPVFRRTDQQWLRDLRLAWDTLNSRWNAYVLGYGPELQRDFLALLGLAGLGWLGLGLAGVAGAGILVLLISLWLLRRGDRVRDPVVRSYARFCARLARAGLARETGEAPRTFAGRVAQARPDLAEPVARITSLYESLRYGPRPTEAAARELKRLVRTFRVSR